MWAGSRRVGVLWLVIAVAAGCGEDEGAPGGGGPGVGGAGGGSGGSGSGAGGGSGGSGGGAGGGGGGGGSGVPYAFVGLSNGEVQVYDLDLVSGALSLRDGVDGGANPSFLAIDPSRRHVYAVNEGSDEMAAFAVGADASLSFLGRVATGSDGPTHVSVDASGRWVFAANYGGGALSIFEVQRDGSLGPASVVSTGVQAHWAGTAPGNAFLFVPNKGSDNVSQLVFDAGTGAVTPNTPAAVATAGGAGPRHLAFHPSAPFAYLINELDDTMTAFAFDAAAGTLSPIQTLSTLPDGTGGGGNTGAEVVVSPDGRFVFGSNRGHDSIVVFSIDAQSGMMTLVEHEQTDIDTPRSFAVDPSGTILLVANQGADSVASFAIEASGALTHLLTTDMPAAVPFVGIFDLPEP